MSREIVDKFPCCHIIYLPAHAISLYKQSTMFIVFASDVCACVPVDGMSSTLYENHSKSSWLKHIEDECCRLPPEVRYLHIIEPEEISSNFTALLPSLCTSEKATML